MKKLILLLCIPILICFVPGCFDDPADSGGGPDYDLSSPEGLAAAFSTAWEGRDLAGWAAMLYNGVEDTGADWPVREFEFYFLNPDVPGTPAASWSLANELSSAGAIFAGEVGEDHEGNAIPGVSKVELTLIPISDWSLVSESAIMGDPCPAGTQFATFFTDMGIILKGGIGNHEINGFWGSGRAELYIVPVTVGDETEYRLWKWVDRYDQYTDIGTIKSYYGEYTPLAYDLASLDTLVGAFNHAWNNMDFEAYLDLLYCGQEHGGDHLPFKFYFLDPDAPGIPGESWLYDDDLASAEGMFGGATGENHEGETISSIESIGLYLAQPFPWTAWNDGEAGEVLGDSCPAGTMYALFDTDALFNLSEPIGESQIVGFQINGKLQFYAIPVDVNGRTEYRLWKWIDLASRADRETNSPGATENTNFGQVKALF